MNRTLQIPSALLGAHNLPVHAQTGVEVVVIMSRIHPLKSVMVSGCESVATYGSGNLHEHS